ncbi:RhuM family protein [Pseudomonas fluorescens]|uniref:RhuM family protein n=1 Tax=Pseudomonas fluorescens TaxID=294 RepID=UPI00374A7BC9
MAELFSTTPENVLMHLNNIFKEAELDQSATTKDFLVVRQEGSRQVKRNIKHYNLDAIISVGYRVHSHTAMRFRQWATRQLREYIVKGRDILNNAGKISHDIAKQHAELQYEQFHQMRQNKESVAEDPRFTELGQLAQQLRENTRWRD